MHYISTRNASLQISAAEAIVQGISADGGLFVPSNIPSISDQFSELAKLDYCALAEKVLSLYLTDFTAEEIKSCVYHAYRAGKFPDKIVDVKKLGNKSDFLLELWHGPTCAFKDMALQLLPHLLQVAAKKVSPDKTALILTATSGDTGKAALEGFQDVPGAKIIVFYPKDGVSSMQEHQMLTQTGNNVQVCAVTGNFDDTQAGVKQIFTNTKAIEKLKKMDFFFSSANSINWGRLLPQIVYYFYAYFSLYKMGEISSLDEPINIAVPTGNFGNILAAYYAHLMGLPVKRFICASNKNNVLTDFFQTGAYDKRRPFFVTNSPSMDILVSSNLERLLFAVSHENANLVSAWMQDLQQDGLYTLDQKTKDTLEKHFFADYCDDEETSQTIKAVFANDNYLCDTHTAVAINVNQRYRDKTGDIVTPSIIASTASPYKFTNSMLNALGCEQEKVSDPFSEVKKLEHITQTNAPNSIVALQKLPIRFNDIIAPSEMLDYVLHAFE